MTNDNDQHLNSSWPWPTTTTDGMGFHIRWVTGTSWNFCPNCGRKLDDKLWKYCADCGCWLQPHGQIITT